MKPLPILIPTVTASDCADHEGKPGWATRVRLARDDRGQPYEFRAGPLNSIEAQSPHAPFKWHWLHLPGFGRSFVSEAERDEALKALI